GTYMAKDEIGRGRTIDVGEWVMKEVSKPRNQADYAAQEES
ncbi:11137_t:CDS:1, partial [Acaulospora colombiana]